METAVLIATIAKYVKLAVDLTPTVIKTVEDAKPFAEAIYNTFKNGNDVTQEDLDKLTAQIKGLSAQLQKPLEPE